jgi:hypothetical protein
VILYKENIGSDSANPGAIGWSLALALQGLTPSC